MSYGIWPDHKLPSKFRYGRESTRELIASVETKCEKYFNKKAWVVLFPSARSALYHILLGKKIHRNESVLISNWSSHCVIESVGRLAMPSVGKLDCTTKAILIHHQWGYVKNVPQTELILIEDSVDSLLCDGSSLFPNDGDFEIFSLPKILGSFCGGVCVCKYREDAEALKALRDNASVMLGKMQNKLKEKWIREKKQLWLSLYNGSESLNGWMGRDALVQIRDMIEDIHHLIEIRKRRLDILEKNGIYLAIKGRIPVVYPLRFSEKRYSRLCDCGYELPVRHYNYSDNFMSQDFAKCIVVPLHQNVDTKDLERILSLCAGADMNREGGIA